MLSRDLFSAFVVLVAVQRALELRVSKRHEALLRRAGGIEHAPGHFPAMQLLHGTWLASILLEVHLLEATFKWGPAIVFLLSFALGQALRLSAMRALGWRWSVRIYTLPSLPPVTSGVYRYLRHPNYLGVALEVAALPLVHGAWRTALAYSLANAALLVVRIRAEERALTQSGGYQESFAPLRRFWPRLPTRSPS
jgi:methyltransferase